MTGPTSNTPPLASKVEFLSHAGAYPEAPGRVEVVETHMSWLFLTDTRVYKLKKPVRYTFLDYSTLEARHLDACEEVRLNRRLAGDVYEDVVPLTVRAGRLGLGEDGQVVDWLVRMRRLPARLMLDNLIRERAVDMSRVRALARVLAGFYQDAPQVALSGAAYRNRLTDSVGDNRRELLNPVFGLDACMARQVSDAQQALLEDAHRLFEARAEQGHLVEGHGDLRPEHVCLNTPPQVIDCLSFKLEFRQLDPVDELSFFAMECDWLGAGDVGAEVLSVYFHDSGDHCDTRMVSFYKCMRACLRAKLALWHTADGDVPDHRRWRDRAGQYLALANGYARTL